MNPIQPPAPATAASPNRSNNLPRRRPDLTLPFPQHEPQTAAPPSSATQIISDSKPPPFDLSDLVRLNRIGIGSGTNVYKVLHGPTGPLFALKVIYGNHTDEVRRGICREVEILRDIDHFNIVKCHGMFDHDGEIQVLLEYMDGGSHEGTHISDEASLAHLTRQVLSGICYLHSRKIVHHDIKPSKFLINSKKQVKLADFGVSRILAQTTDPCNSSVGTIAYMSPERINTDLNHGIYDGYAGDIWSLGVSILELYLGRFPFAVESEGDWASLMCAICIADPPEAPATASREFRDFVSCCLQRDPSRRWTAARLLEHPFIIQVAQGVEGKSMVQDD